MQGRLLRVKVFALQRGQQMPPQRATQCATESALIDILMLYLHTLMYENHHPA